jgi:hypothetical protein
MFKYNLFALVAIMMMLTVVLAGIYFLWQSNLQDILNLCEQLKTTCSVSTQ